MSGIGVTIGVSVKLHVLVLRVGRHGVCALRIVRHDVCVIGIGFDKR